MEPGRLFLSDAESQAAKVLSADLQDYLDAAGRAHDDIAAILEEEQTLAESPNLPRSVSVLLLNRISNDLRSCVLLSERGYALQASSLAASVVEFAEAIMVIGDDSSLAQKWMDHETLTESFPTRCTWQQLQKETGLRTKHHVALSRARVPHSDLDSLAEQLGGIYSQLCAAKHGNPNVLQMYAFDLHGHEYHFTNGPSTTETARQFSRHALLAAILMAMEAVSLFVVNHMPAESDARFGPRLGALLESIVLLGTTARQQMSDSAKDSMTMPDQS